MTTERPDPAVDDTEAHLATFDGDSKDRIANVTEDDTAGHIANLNDDDTEGHLAV